MFSTTYSLNLSGYNGNLKIADSGVGFGYAGSALGAGYADMFRRDRAPTQGELLSHLVGTAFLCAKLNSDLVSSTKLRLYLRTDKNQPKAKFVQYADLNEKIVTTRKGIHSRISKMNRDRMTRSTLLDATDRGSDTIEEVLDHPVLDLLRQPEDAFTDGGLPPFSHRWATMMQLESLARSYWYVQEWSRVPGMGKIPKRLILLRSQLVSERVDTTGKAYIKFYEYGTNKFDPEEIIRFTYPDPSNPHLGFLSPMRAAIEKIRLARCDDALLEALLQNGGYPTAVMSPADPESVIGDAEAARMVSGWRTSTSQSKAGGLLVMKTANVKLQAMAFKPAEIVDPAKYTEIVGQIADCFNVPRTKIFRNDSNRASAESGDAAHAKDAGLPRCCMIEESLNAQLIPLFDPSGRLFLAFDSPVPANKEFEADMSKAGLATGGSSVNEYRIGMGMEPTDDMLGECHLLPKGVTVIKPDGEIIQTAPDPVAPDGQDQQGQPPPTPPKKKPTKSRERKMLRMLKGLTEKLNVEAMQRNGAVRELQGGLQCIRDHATETATKERDEGDARIHRERVATERLRREGYSLEEVKAMRREVACAGEL